MNTPGTITVTKHSTAIVGVGTDFDCDDNLEGKYIRVVGNNEWYMIKTVTDDTNIILDRAYRGETASSQYYELGSDQQWQKPDIIGKDEHPTGKFTLP